MQKRKLGKNGPELTTIGFGAWAIGGAWLYGWGEQDDDTSIKTIREGLDLGINCIDTAAVYGLGHSEEVVAEAIAGNRDNVFIATKCGLVWNSKGRTRFNSDPVSIRSQVEESLKRLKTDYIDLYQIHWPDPKTPVEKSWEVMTKLKEEGKVRCIGVSNFDVSLLEKCLQISHVDSLQPQYNLLTRDIEGDILPYCEQNGIGVIAYSPMLSGLLTGKFNIAKVAKDDWRKYGEQFKEPNLTKNLNFVESLKPMAQKYGKTVGQLAIAWVLKHSAVTSAIVGARHPDQVKENVRAVDFEIEKEDILKLDELSGSFLDTAK
ncbi:aldo/keto reductase [candidate division KSB1 bacterium]|nr:aldo/keto reductase [candidate division KSB1 bacterium]